MYDMKSSDGKNEFWLSAQNAMSHPADEMVIPQLQLMAGLPPVLGDAEGAGPRVTAALRIGGFMPTRQAAQCKYLAKEGRKSKRFGP